MDKLLGRYLPIRFIIFGLLGLFGLAVHLATLSVCFRIIEFIRVPAVGSGAAVAPAVCRLTTSARDKPRDHHRHRSPESPHCLDTDPDRAP